MILRFVSDLENRADLSYMIDSTVLTCMSLKPIVTSAQNSSVAMGIARALMWSKAQDQVHCLEVLSSSKIIIPTTIYSLQHLELFFNQAISKRCGLGANQELEWMSRSPQAHPWVYFRRLRALAVFRMCRSAPEYLGVNFYFFREVPVAVGV